MALKFKSKREAWRAILHASGIDDHDYRKADRKFEQYQCERQHDPKPPPWNGGELDAVNETLGFKVSGPLEGFMRLTEGATTCPDCIYALHVLRQVPGLSTLRFPDEIYDTITQQLSYWHGVDVAMQAA